MLHNSEMFTFVGYLNQTFSKSSNFNIMKHLISTVIFIVCGIFCVQFAFCDTIPTKGEWSEQDFRSVVPAPPAASIEGKVLTVNFVNPLANLTVKVADSKTGQVIYEECISASSPQSHSVILNAENGDYTLSFSHQLGYLTGNFVIK